MPAIDAILVQSATSERPPTAGIDPARSRGNVRARVAGLHLDQSHDRLGAHTVVLHCLGRLVALQTLFEFPGSRNVRVVMPIGPKNSSRFDEAAQ